MNGQAICKDCGNGTLNNLTNEQFELSGLERNGDYNEFVICKRCGSSHIDGQLEVA
jgi:hypothetical protein